MRDTTIVVFDGQSLNNGPGAAQTFPYLAMQGRGLPWMNVSVSGKSWTVLGNTFTPEARVDPHASQYPRSVLCLTGGTSDLSAPESNTWDTAFLDMIGYGGNRREAGYDIVLAATITPSHYLTATENDQRVRFNTELLAQGAAYGIDGIADLDAAMPDNTNATYYADGTHFTAAGAQVAADVWSTLLDSIL